MSRGVLYVAYGEKARREARESMAALRERNDLPLAVISDEPMGGVQNVKWDTPGKGARFAKLNGYWLSPYRYTLYLDADTRPRADVSVGFDILGDGWDLVMAPSENQEQDWLWHIGEEERKATQLETGRRALQLQAGVMWFRKNDRMDDLFSEWEWEWTRWADQDQAALLRALDRCPVKIWLMGRPWNGGALINHLFGRTRRG